MRHPPHTCVAAEPCAQTCMPVATFAAGVLGALGSMRARRTGQRGATALTPVKHDRLRRLWPMTRG
eukprot:3869049-Prymnesium_polylepis.1